MADELERLRDDLRTAREALEYVLEHHSDGRECLCRAARSVAAAALSLTAEPAGEKITHGRHCTCSACAREDWTDPLFACCGMHGPGCPNAYQPLGLAGTWSEERSQDA